ncbi:hypothetical protein, partial [Pseudomonas sp. PH1b]|uniref:hypothetical protein n=1 Tax=Pseudomonas sp. PH1b TaxID=1397282 RepID=UPI001C4391EE
MTHLPHRPCRLQSIAPLSEMQHLGAAALDLDLVAEIHTGQDRIVIDDHRHQPALGITEAALVHRIHLQLVGGAVLAGGVTIDVAPLPDQPHAQLLKQIVIKQKALALAVQLQVEDVDLVGGGGGNLYRFGRGVIVGF